MRRGHCGKSWKSSQLLILHSRQTGTIRGLGLPNNDSRAIHTYLFLHFRSFKPGSEIRTGCYSYAIHRGSDVYLKIQRTLPLSFKQHYISHTLHANASNSHWALKHILKLAHSGWQGNRRNISSEFPLWQYLLIGSLTKRQTAFNF